MEEDFVADLKGYMLISQPDLKFLSTVLVLLGPFRIVFPVGHLEYKHLKLDVTTNFMISLSLMMRLISEIMRELTHTAQT